MSIFGNSWHNSYRATTKTSDSESLIVFGDRQELTWPVIFNSYRLEESERLQVLETFNDLVHVYAYGRSIGRLTLGGMVMPSGTFPGITDNLHTALMKKYQEDLRAFKRASNAGNEYIRIAGPRGLYLDGILGGLLLEVTAETDSIAAVTLSLLLPHPLEDSQTT